MSILKVNILASKIEINYEDAQKERLIQLIKEFKKRLRYFPNNGNINDKTIIFLSALKCEDELNENKKILSDIQKNQIKISDLLDRISKLDNEHTHLKKEISGLQSEKLIELSNNTIAIEKIKNLEKLIETIQIKIKDELSS